MSTLYVAAGTHATGGGMAVTAVVSESIATSPATNLGDILKRKRK